MDKNLKDLLEKTILYKYSYDNDTIPIKITNFKDEIYSCGGTLSDVSKLIIDGIVEYSFNENEIKIQDLTRLQLLALERKLRFNKSSSETVKKSYGFYGEIILDLLLKGFKDTHSIISKGHFYYPLEDNEAKGFDSFHIIENSDCIELWFGESKFRGKYHNSVNEILDGFEKAFSMDYLNTNMVAIIEEYNNLNIEGGKLYDLLTEWRYSPGFKISEFIDDYNIKLYYPIFISYDITPGGFEKSLELVTKYIKTKFDEKNIDLSKTKWNRYFIFLPVESISQIKEGVIKWIEELI
jgi:hypothetical protein